MKNQSVKNSEAVLACAESESVLLHLSGVCREKFQALKNQLKNHLESEYGHALDGTRIQQVLNEADALAAYTPFPALFLPTLAEEKARAVVTWQGKQQLLRSHGVAYALAA